jgi:hypothetical protein
MVLFFFYKNFTNIELIKKIDKNFNMYDGYVMVHKYDSENDILEISDKNNDNNLILVGKIIEFNKKLEHIICKINEIDECKLKNIDRKYIMNTIWTNKSSGGINKAYIIY